MHSWKKNICLMYASAVENPSKHMVYWEEHTNTLFVNGQFKQEWISSLLEEIRSVLQRYFSINNNIEEIR